MNKNVLKLANAIRHCGATNTIVEQSKQLRLLQHQLDELKQKKKYFTLAKNTVFLALQHALQLQDVAEIVHSYEGTHFGSGDNLFVRSFGCSICRLRHEKGDNMCYGSDTQFSVYQLPSCFLNNSYLLSANVRHIK